MFWRAGVVVFTTFAFRVYKIRSFQIMQRSIIVGLGLIASAQAAYIWPSPHDHIEDLLYLQSGYIRFGSLSDRSYYLRCLPGHDNANI